MKALEIGILALIILLSPLIVALLGVFMVALAIAIHADQVEGDW